MKNLRTLLILLLISISASAQIKSPSSGRQPAYFIYSTGERTDHKLKVMLISTHIFLGQDHDLPQNSISVSFSLDFDRIEKKVEENERMFPAEYDNIRFSNNEVETVYGSSLNWNFNWPHYEKVTSSDNSLDAMEKIRTSIIEEYRAKGYKVYQVDFRPGYEGENRSGYLYYVASSASYRQYRLDRVLPLSPLYIPYYREGEIKSMLESIGSSSGGSGGYSGSLVIEEKKESSNNNNKGSTPAKEEDDPGKWERLALAHMWESNALEARADSMYKMGTLFYPSALELYQQAYTLYPSPRVQAKIDNINSWMALGKAFNQLAEGIDNGVAKLDPKKKTRFMHFSLGYSGLMSSYEKITNAQDQDPMEAFFGITGHRTCFSIQFRFGYMKSPVYEYNVETVDYTGSFPTGEKVKLQQEGVSMGMSIGLNIPMKNVVAYGLYGYDFILINAGSGLRSEGYSLDEQPVYPLGNNKFTFGITYHIPKTNVGFGIHYNLNTVKGEDDGANKVQKNTNPNKNYYLNSTTTEKYKWNNAGMSFSWGFNR